jgi:DNA invertase Pin-like site-specific DNA recombinase
MGTCAIYCRISLDKTGQMAGVQRQETECRELAARLGLEVERVYVDNDVSAFSGKRRPQFEALLAAGPEAIVVWHLDRLVRRMRDLEPVIALDVNVYAVSSGLADLSTPTGRMAARMTTVISQYESEQKGERQKAMHRQRRAQGRVWWSIVPYGFEKDGTPVDPAAIEAIYRKAVAGDSLASIGRDVDMSPHGVRKLLANERNLPIVGPELWDQANSILRSRRHGYRHGVGMLTGVATCGTCDGPVGVGTSTTRPGRFYKCRLGHVIWEKELIDEYVGIQVADVLAGARDEIEAKPHESVDELAALSADFVAGRLTAETFTAAVERVKQRAARPASPWVPWAQLTEPERRELCRAVLEAVVLPARGHGRYSPQRVQSVELRWRTQPE